MKKLDTISPLVGPILGLLYAESHTFPITTVVTEYVNIMNSVCGQNERQQWTHVEISRLRRDIWQLKATAVGFFIAY